MISPGLRALPPGRFSDAAMIPTVRTGRSSRATACIAPKTAAAPDISNFMSHMPSEPLMEMPPESNVMPLPTRTTGRSSGLPPVCSSTMTLGGSALPCATARMVRMPRSAIPVSSMTSHFSPTLAAICCARSASPAGVRSFPGAVARSRAHEVASARICPASAPRSTSVCRVPSNSTIVSLDGPDGPSSSSVLYAVYL